MSPTGQSVNEQVSYRMWVSAELVLGATIIAAVLGIWLGVYTASRQYKLADRIGQATSIITMNVNIIVAGLAVVLLAISLNEWTGVRIFYVTGSSSPGVTGFFPVLVDTLQHLTLPTIALVIVGYAQYHFLQRSLLLDNINADYVRTARAKGLTKAQAVRKHALRTSLIPVATQVAFTIPTISPARSDGADLRLAGHGAVLPRHHQQQRHQRRRPPSPPSAPCLTAIGAVLADIIVVVLDPRVRVS